MIRHIIKANSILLIQYAVGSLVPLLLIPHIISVIGLSEYGNLAVLMAWGGYGAAIVQYSFNLTGPKRVMQLKPGETTAGVFIEIFAVKIILLFGVLIFTAFIFLFISNEIKMNYAWLILLAIPAAASFNSIWLLQSQDKFLHICVMSIAGSLLTLFIGFYFIKKTNENSFYFAVIASILGILFVGFFTFIISIFILKIDSFKVKIINIINSLKDGWNLFVSQFISMAYSASGPIVINYFVNSEAAGAYSVTERVVSALMAAALLTHTAAYPRLASSYNNDRVSYWRIIKIILIGYVVATMTASLIIWTERDSVLSFLYGSSSEDQSSLLLFGLIWLVTGIFGTTLTGYLTVSGQSAAVWPLTLKILIVSLLLGILGIKMLGGYGWLVGLLAAQSIVFHTGFKYWKFNYGK